MDETDVEILKVLMDRPGLTGSGVAKAVFDPKSDLELRKKDSFVRYRLAVLESYGLVKKTMVKRKSCYRVPLEDITLGKVTVTIPGCDEPVEVGNCLYMANGECNRLILLD